MAVAQNKVEIPVSISVSAGGPGVLIPQQTVAHNSFVRPVSISENGTTAQITYNGDGERVKMTVASGTDTLLTRYYIGGRYEYEQTPGGVKERLYLGGDAYSAPMVYQKDSLNGVWTVYNIGRDYLGNITHVVTNSGTLVAEYSYDPWGRLRDPQTLAIYAPGQEPALFLGRGFTGHEHLPWFGLINMNARLYDPLVGRFLSPDPFVQAPDFTQNYNRYSYALNNPLKYSDESGEFILTTMLIVGGITAAVFGLGNLAAHAIRKDDLGHGNWANYFFSGALAGFVVGSLGYAGFSGAMALAEMPGALGFTGKALLWGAAGVTGLNAISTTTSIVGGTISRGWHGFFDAGKIILGNFYLDENKSFLGQTWEGISRHTWEYPQQAVGYFWSGIRNCWADRVDYLGGATFITNENSNGGGISFASFINYNYLGTVTGAFDSFVKNNPAYMHEYGHSIDSKIFGISYLLCIGLLSAVSATRSSQYLSPEGFYTYEHNRFLTERRANKNASAYFNRFYGVSWSSDTFIIPGSAKRRTIIDNYPY